MRIIAGSRKSLPLKTIPGDRTRPTPDRIKETLFNIIGPYIRGSRFLDLFAGSGGIGLEALSRGASFACFIEKNRQAAGIIKENIDFAGFGECAELIRADAVRVFSERECGRPFDIVFLDPPYRMGYEKKIIRNIRGSGWAADGALFIAEAAADDDISWTAEPFVKLLRIKKYKTNMHILFQLTKGEFPEI